jgi:hypothetical protein
VGVGFGFGSKVYLGIMEPLVVFLAQVAPEGYFGVCESSDSILAEDNHQHFNNFSRQS